MAILQSSIPGFMHACTYPEQILHFRVREVQGLCLCPPSNGLPVGRKSPYKTKYNLVYNVFAFPYRCYINGTHFIITKSYWD